MKTMLGLEPHPNLVNLIGACREEMSQKQIYIILEYYPLGDMRKFLQKNNEQFRRCIKNESGYLDSDLNANLLKSWSLGIAKARFFLLMTKSRLENYFRAKRK